MRTILSKGVFLFSTVLATAAAATEIDSDRLFAELDANGDGQLAANEVGSVHRLLFGRLLRTGDENGDGRLGAEEFAAGLQPVRAEKSPVEKQGSRLPGADALVVLLAKMDANADGRIEADEVPEDYQTAYERMLGPGDDDKDGNLSAREIARGAPRFSALARFATARMGLDIEAELEKLPASQRESMESMDAYPRIEELLADPQETKKLFKRLDANGDKRLSADEATGPLADRLAMMIERGDEDGDKHLNSREFSELAERITAYQEGEADPAAAKRLARQLLARFDRDRDGQLAAEEAPPRMARGFQQVDGDANGRLDRTEIEAAAEMMARLRPGNRPEMMDGESASETSAKPKKGNPEKPRKKRRNK